MSDSGSDALLAELDLEPVDLPDTQRNVVKQWKSYGADLMVYCEELLEYGVATSPIPKPPSEPLRSKGSDSKSARVSGTKLHEYLLQYLVADVSTPFDQPTEITTLLDAQQHLKRGYERRFQRFLCSQIESRCYVAGRVPEI